MTLKLGDESQNVANWQRVLISLGYDVEADGDFGDRTAKATRAFQASQNLRADGIVGDMTLKAAEGLKPAVGSVKAGIIFSFKTSSQNLIGLDKVHPVLAEKARIIVQLAADEGYQLQIAQGLRTFAEQDKLFAKHPKVTNARGGQSMHNYGLAVDFVFVVNGTIDYKRDDHLYNNIGGWSAIANLEWGGDWKSFKDRPHVQLKNLPSFKVLRPIYDAGGLSAVWKKYQG